MTRIPSLFIGLVLLVVLSLAAAGCAPPSAPSADVAPTPVSVSHPVERNVTDYADFTGRTAAVDSVEVRARVWGYLDKVNFEEEMLVQQGDVLFEIDPRTYQAALAQAQANFLQLGARVRRLDADLARARRLVGEKVISREAYDKTVGDRDEAEASLEAMRAAVERAKLDLEYTKVVAPISGRRWSPSATLCNRAKRAARC